MPQTVNSSIYNELTYMYKYIRIFISISIKLARHAIHSSVDDGKTTCILTTMDNSYSKNKYIYIITST